jgi:tetraacyldisaccharide 4'-kinase
VDALRHRASAVGDEPLLLAAFAPTWVARDRMAGGLAAVADGADVLLLDDGMQNNALAKDLTILVADAAAGFGNGRVAPAGPLREPVDQGMERADLVLAIGSEEDREKFFAEWPETSRKPCIGGALDPLETGMDWQNLRVLAFAGIGRPEKFYATLRGLGAEIVQTHSFDDHQPLPETLLRRMESEAAEKGLQLVTTEKDAVRLPQTFQQKVLTLPVRLKIADDSALTERLEALLQA